MEPMLEVKNLSVGFKGKKGEKIAAVQKVSFRLYPGQVLGIVGESGSGKSTVAKAVTRLIEPTEGSIFLKGQEITHVKGKELRGIYKKIQMVFQSPGASLDMRSTLGDGSGASLRNRKIPRKERERRVKELMERCGLSCQLASAYPRQVSGGQCQRAAIARALAAEPEILVCDEATSALDTTVQRQIMDLLMKLREERGLSCLFICHNLALVQSFCHRVLVMEAGRIVEEGDANQVIASPVSDYAKRLVEAAQ